MKIDRFFDYLPKLVYDTRHAIATKFAADNVDDNPGLTDGHVTIKWILLRCNIAFLFFKQQQASDIARESSKWSLLVRGLFIDVSWLSCCVVLLLHHTR